MFLRFNTRQKDGKVHRYWSIVENRRLRTDRKTGALAFTGHYAPVGNPSVIVFLDLGAVR